MPYTKSFILLNDLLNCFIKKGTLAQVFSCEFCEIPKNAFSYRTPLETASEFKGDRGIRHCRHQVLAFKMFQKALLI